MRKRAKAAWLLLALAIAAGLLGRQFAKGGQGPEWAWSVPAGLCLGLAALLALSLLPVWPRSFTALPAIPDLWQAPARGGWWCVRCGVAVGANGACRTCGRPRPVPWTRRMAGKLRLSRGRRPQRNQAKPTAPPPGEKMARGK